MKDYLLCTDPNDPFLDREMKTIWIATMYSGLIVYEDDIRMKYCSCNEKLCICDKVKAWYRLHHYVSETGDGIRHLKIEFRSNSLSFDTSDNMCYLGKGVGKNSTSGGNADAYYIFGVKQPVDQVMMNWYKVPELQFFQSRQIPKSELMSPPLITW